MVIYADVLILVNFAMNALVLMLVRHITNLRCPYWRIGVSALLGAAYSLYSILFYETILNYGAIKVILSIMMVLFICWPCTKKKFLVVLAGFYLCSFVLGGAALAVLLWTGTGIVVNGAIVVIQPIARVLSVASVIVFIIGLICWNYLRPRLWQRHFYCPIEIWINDSKINITALLDTGNQLHDPISGLPVVILEYGIIKDQFPYDHFNSIHEAACSGENEAYLAYKGSGHWKRITYIPYQSVGNNRILMGFKPDKIVIYSDNGVIETGQVVIGLYNKSLSVYGDYHALLHPELFI